MKFRKLISVIVAAVLTLGMFSVAAGAVGEREADNGALQFNEDGKLVVLHITDIQDRYPMNSVGKRYLIDILDRVQPDLIILGGDNIAGNCTFSKIAVRYAINEYMSIFEERGIKVAAVFGNHDAENSHSSKEYQLSLYESYDCYIGCAGYTEADRVGTYNLPVLSSDGSRVAFNFWLFDSGDYNKENDLGGYACVTKGQIEWYKETSARLTAENGGEPVPSIAFQHIVVPEIYDALQQVEKGTEGAIEKTFDSTGETKYYVLPEGAEGELLEGPCPPEYSNGQFDAMVETGDVLAAVFGHDHRNTFNFEYKGIRLMNSPCMSFAVTSYNGTNMGVRVFEIDENDPESFGTYTIDYDYMYDEDEVIMKYGFDSSIQDNSVFKRLYSWFIYKFYSLFKR